MTELDEIYVRLFVVVPLVVYVGYCIIQNKSHTSSILFHILVLLMIALTLFFHMKYLIKIIRRIFNNEKYQKEFGVFLLFLATFLFVLCLYDLYHLNKKN